MYAKIMLDTVHFHVSISETGSTTILRLVPAICFLDNWQELRMNLELSEF
jgi:hypothetical protein